MIGLNCFGYRFYLEKRNLNLKVYPFRLERRFQTFLSFTAIPVDEFHEPYSTISTLFEVSFILYTSRMTIDSELFSKRYKLLLNNVFFLTIAVILATYLSK